MRHRGREIIAIDNPSDAVQKHLKRGAFYELVCCGPTATSLRTRRCASRCELGNHSATLTRVHASA